MTKPKSQNATSFLSHKAQSAGFLSPQPDTSLHCNIADMQPLHRVLQLFTTQLSLVLTAPIHKRMAILS